MTVSPTSSSTRDTTPAVRSPPPTPVSRRWPSTSPWRLRGSSSGCSRRTPASGRARSWTRDPRLGTPRTRATSSGSPSAPSPGPGPPPFRSGSRARPPAPPRSSRWGPSSSVRSRPSVGPSSRRRRGATGWSWRPDPGGRRRPRRPAGARPRRQRYLDQARVLDHVDVAVHHGGTGTTLGLPGRRGPAGHHPARCRPVPQRLAARRARSRACRAQGRGAGRGRGPPSRGGPRRRRYRLPSTLVRTEIAAMPPPEQVVETLVRHEPLPARGRTHRPRGVGPRAPLPRSGEFIALVDLPGELRFVFDRVHHDAVMLATDLTTVLRAASLRVTRPRLAVLAARARPPARRHRHGHRAVRADLPAVSHQAVYDVLRALTDAGLVRRIQPAGSVARYEVAGRRQPPPRRVPLVRRDRRRRLRRRRRPLPHRLRRPRLRDRRGRGRLLGHLPRLRGRTASLESATESGRKHMSDTQDDAPREAQGVDQKAAAAARSRTTR